LERVTLRYQRSIKTPLQWFYTALLGKRVYLHRI
jgi:hypothetical protein